MKFLKRYLPIFILLLSTQLGAQHISNFQSVNPNGRNATLVLPETHTFQKIIQNGDAMTGGATFSAATDFTGYVPINGSSINGYLSVNNESSTGGVIMLDINFNQNSKLWNVSYSKNIDFSAFGRTSKNCSGAVTPWGTIITSEEVGSSYNDINNDGYNDYGWQVEIDPKTKQVIDKRWAMGRFAHENAVVHKNWRTVYQGTDSGSGYLYKFVADFPGDLSSGKLYAYKGSKTGGSGQWVQIPNSTKYQRNNTQTFAANAGATAFAGIEDVEIGPDGLVYFTVKNEYKIYYFEDSDPINGTSVSFLNKFAGNRNYTIPTANGNVNHNWGYGNDNLAFDTEGNLWVLQDGVNSHIWVVRKGHTESNPKVEIFATSPSGSEPTGITFSPDGRFMFLSIQHPSSGNGNQKDATGNNMRFNTPTTIVIARKEFLGASCDNDVCSTCTDGIRNFAEVDVDCGGPCQACETCYDRIKNGNETGVDCGTGCVTCPSLNVAKTDITCDSGVKGSAIAQVTGGSGNITYLWSTGDTTSVVNNLSAGNYTVKISDKNGNTQQESFSISQASSMNTSYTANPPSSPGTSNGSINVSVSGGKSPYNYEWSNNSSSQDLSNLSTGTYRLKVTDSNDCVVFMNVPLNVLDCNNFEVELSKTDISCRFASDGMVAALTAGGAAPFSYSWSNGSSSQQINNLNSGNYTVTVNDSNGCSVTNSISLIQSTSALSVNLNENDISAIDENDGSVSAQVSGGKSPYSYEWSNGSTSNSISNLEHGSYDIKVTDSKGCAVFKTAVIEDYTCNGIININLTATDINCFGDSNGIINAYVTGGSTPYSYKWSTGSTASGIAFLKPGTYNLTVTDSKGCKGYASETINQTAPIEIDHTYINETYELLIDTLLVDSIIVNTMTMDSIVVDTLTVDSLVYDGMGMVIDTLTVDSLAIDTIVINTFVNDTIQVDSLAIDTLVFNGSANVSVIGGSGIFTYNWSNGATTNNINNAPAGNYEVMVSDQNSCTVSKTITILPYTCSSLMVSLDKNNGICTSDGSITATVSGGSQPYTYLWSNGSTSSSISGLSGGTYSVEIQDSNGCTYTETAEIFESIDPLTLSTQSIAVTAFNSSDGKAIVAVEGGIPPYTYSWSNGASNAIVNNLSEGNYTVTVTDAAGCSVNKTVNVSNVDCSDMSVTLNREHGKCGGSVKGYILADVDNAVSPISYSWNNNNNTAYLENVSSGSYQLTATDARGCSKNKSTSVNNGSSLSVSVNGNDLSAFDSNDGSASLNVSGGSSPYSYKWSTGATGTSVNNLTPGVYEALVTDRNGCVATDDVTIDNVDCTANNFKAKLTYENVNCKNGNDGSIKVNPTGGYSPYIYTWPGSTNSGSSRSNLSSGSYLVIITDSKNCSISTTQTISQPSSQLILSVAKTNETYYNASNGSATATANGGTPPYQYNWSSGAGGSALKALPGGSYSVEVVDANGCSVTKSFSISGINCDNISLNVNAEDALCYNADSGSATALATGGSQPYTISWTNNEVGNSVNNFSKGIYEAYVIDNVGCSTYRELTIDEPTELNSSISKTNVTYYGQNNGTASVTASNGTPPYSYTWNNGVSTRNIFNLAPGSYTVTIRDGNGCNRTAQAIVEDVNCNNIRVNNLFVTDVSCYGDNDGRIVAQVSGGSTPYTYDWTSGQSSGTITGLSGGSYTLNAKGSKGCPASKTATVSVPSELQVNLTANNESFFGENDGSAGINVSGGTAPYTVSWSNGSNSLLNNNLAPGNYSVVVEDSNDCQYTENVTIGEGCRKVYNLLANGVTNSSAIINWTGDVNDGSYNIQYRNVTDGSPWQTLSTSQERVLLTNLKACKTYEFGIFSDCDPSNGVFVRFTTGGCTACTATTNLYTLNVTEQSAFLNWDIYPTASYILYYRAKGTSTWFQYETDFSFAILFGLDDCKDYQWFIRTNCNVGLSPNSAYQEFTTGCNREGDLSNGRSYQLIDKVYPNPVIDQLVVEHNFKDHNSTEFEIYDAAGLLHYKASATESPSKLNLNHLPKGLFTLYIKQADAVEAVKFVKE